MRARLLTRGCRDADKCCIDQSSPEMIAAGVSSFGAFLKGVVRERERADDELRRAADKQLARIEFGE